MNIGFYSPALPGSGLSNGIVTYVRIMRKALRALGHQVTVVSLDHIEHSDGSVETLPKKRVLFGDYCAKQIVVAFEAAKSAGVDVFEIEESFGWARRLKGVPVIVRLHGPHCFVNNDSPRRVRDEFEALKWGQMVTSPTEALLKAMIDKTDWPISGDYIPNPVEIPSEQWSADDADPDQILFVGRNDHVKGADIALAAFELAKQQRPSLRPVCVGPGFETMPPVQVHELRMRSSLALSTSRFETFSYAIAEAMALGMPVVASSTFGGRSLVSDWTVGRPVPIGDVEATAQAILEIIGNAEIGKRARERVTEQFAPLDIARRMLDVYARAALPFAAAS